VTPFSPIEDSGLSGIRSQEKVFFIVTAMKASNSTLKSYNFWGIFL
jgi:hypothetical protein